jgi:MFS family permease
MAARNIPLLSVAQTIGSSGLSMMALVAGIVGAQLAPTPALSTLPLTVQVFGLALSTIPASLLMQRIGRRLGFVLSAVTAVFAALLAAYAVAQGSFALFCTAIFFTGMNGAFIQQYRFAATESVEPQFAGRAVSLVLVGGILAGFIGPEIAKRTKDAFAAEYVGAFVALAVLYGLLAVVLVFLKDVKPRGTGMAAGGERPLRAIVAQHTYLVALLAGVVGYGVMTFTMTATPIHLHTMHHHSIDETAWVIQSHVIAMFLPSLFTGFLVDRIGVLRLMLLGILAMFGNVVLGIFGSELIHYWAELVLLGIGWNFLFVGGTVLLPQSYTPAERFKAQATNDFIIFGVQALASLSAGIVVFSSGWIYLNLISIPFLLLVLVAVLSLQRRVVLAPATPGG